MQRAFGGVEYTILPSSSSGYPQDSRRSRPSFVRRTAKRYTRVLIACTTCFAVYVLIRYIDSGEDLVPKPKPWDPRFSENHSGLPPLYNRYHEYERNLPQHNLDLPPPDGRYAKYIFMANHAWGTGTGWGNVQQEMILNTQLAFLTKRSMVFDNYTWSRDPADYSSFNGKLIPARVPLSTMLSGPMIGAPYGPDSNVPRAVSQEFFRKVCPEPTIIFSEEVKDTLINPTASEVMNAWVKKINSMEDRCIEIEKDSGQLFDIWLLGSKNILDIWDSLSQSPVLRQFGWSPLILSAFETNKKLFEVQVSPVVSMIRHMGSVLPLSSDDPSDTLRGLMTVHIRRGDFEDHCYHLARWAASFNGFNSFDVLPDKFEVPPGGGWGKTTPENEAIYLQRCYPDMNQIVAKIMAVKSELNTSGVGDPIRRLYVMTNGAREWLDELKTALRIAAQAEGWSWDGIATSRDLVLTPEQKYVSQALDMYVGQRAQVMIGNGFSSLTSNVVLQRVARGYDPLTTRFW
ncbi:hypothetical protein FISHEDRAFT_50228 [Fistulina hepatica ATCC 64428]|uniref:Uncharacterized protein n=1 Tax=Fistulina hepatica ATCC 64428 TaxID=1128425 RepID=A0A0D7A1S7_9AGAR|nr:hypothetical protein FISHEDRAFT_50228 [Fistulina hepatica ATCC 64428]